MILGALLLGEGCAPAEEDPALGSPSPPAPDAGAGSDLCETDEFGRCSHAPGATAGPCGHVRRVAGGNRFDTAARLAASRRFEAAEVAVLAQGADISPDALAAGPLAYSLGAPLLLTATEELPAETRAALESLPVRRVLLIGGRAAISDTVVTQLREMGLAVERISGGDRYETAVAIAERVGVPDGLAFVASGADANLVDALAAAGPAARLGVPIFLVPRDRLPASVRDAMRALGVSRTIVAGGREAVSDAVLDALPSPTRVGGADRFETAVAVLAAAEAHGFAVGPVFVARADRMPDALAAAALGQATLLSNPGGVPEPSMGYLRAKDPARVTLLGGTAALGEVVAEQACAPRHEQASLEGTVTDHVVFETGITDHADRGKRGSIAWFFEHTAPGEVVTLHSAGSYRLEGALVVPEGVVLRGRGDGRQVLLAGAGLDGATLIGLQDGVSLQDLTLDGNRHAKTIVSGSDIEGVELENNRIVNTKNHWPAGADPRCHAVYLARTRGSVILGNEISDVGYPKVQGDSWQGVCAGIYAPQSQDLTIEGNTVARSLTAGIDFTGSLRAVIRGNVIVDTGRNVEHGMPRADGITAYHNLSGVEQGWVVEHNEVRGSGHNGIHLSGAGVVVRHNTVVEPDSEGILHQDHKSPADCAWNVQILDNHVSGLRAHHRAVYVGNDYRRGSVTVARSGSPVMMEESYCP